jgi:hypothetical protein
VWEVRDTVLVELLEPGDIVDCFGAVIHVSHVEDHPTDNNLISIHGADDEWGENGAWEYPAGHIIGLMQEE